MTQTGQLTSDEPPGGTGLECTKGTLVYVRRTLDEPGRPVDTSDASDIPLVSYEVPVANARPVAGELSLDREGFTMLKHSISCGDERDPYVMRDRYLAEMVPFIKDYFDASWVVPKNDAVILRSAGESSNISRMAHVDYAPVAGPVLAARESHIQGVAIRPYSRLMIIQTWRALSPPPQDFPLAFCDASTIVHSDMIEVDYGREGPSWQKSWLLRFASPQRWYYFPELTSDELILFKAYDSETHYHTRAAHTAFDDRGAFPNAISRESVEARFFVYFD